MVLCSSRVSSSKIKSLLFCVYQERVLRCHVGHFHSHVRAMCVCVCVFRQTNGEYRLLSFIIQIIIYLIFVVHFIRGSFLTLLLEILPPVLLCVRCLCWVSFVSEYAYY